MRNKVQALRLLLRHLPPPEPPAAPPLVVPEFTEEDFRRLSDEELAVVSRAVEILERVRNGRVGQRGGHARRHRRP